MENYDCGARKPGEIQTVQFELIGGLYDGQIIGGASAGNFILFTDGGTIGKRFSVVGVGQSHEYKVTERRFDNGDLRVRARYVGVA
jgi:hypothetical protein